jgi:hypothetical protein
MNLTNLSYLSKSKVKKYDKIGKNPVLLVYEQVALPFYLKISNSIITVGVNRLTREGEI